MFVTHGLANSDVRSLMADVELFRGFKRHVGTERCKRFLAALWLERTSHTGAWLDDRGWAEFSRANPDAPTDVQVLIRRFDVCFVHERALERRSAYANYAMVGISLYSDEDLKYIEANFPNAYASADQRAPGAVLTEVLYCPDCSAAKTEWVANWWNKLEVRLG